MRVGEITRDLVGKWSYKVIGPGTTHSGGVMEFRILNKDKNLYVDEPVHGARSSAGWLVDAYGSFGGNRLIIASDIHGSVIWGITRTFDIQKVDASHYKFQDKATDAVWEGTKLK